jgi:thioredoxin 1
LKNLIDSVWVGLKKGKTGKGESSLASERIFALKDADFKKTVSESTTPVLVDFWAEWCGPCKMIAPVVEEIAAEYEGQVRVGKLNVDENQGTPASLKVISIPTLILFKGGQEVERSIGYKTKEELRRLISKHI